MNSNFGTPKNSKGRDQAAAGGGGSQKAKRRDKGENSGNKKQRVFINRVTNNIQTKSAPTTPQTASSKPPQLLPYYQYHQPPSMNNYFGPKIPEEVMENVLFRFLYNIPENEKSDQIRICFHSELAHWFYLDFYCPDGAEPPTPNCKKLSFAQFVRQVYFKCDYLEKWRPEVDQIMDSFRQYKSNVPTYGVIMLDSTLNYILLVQGYFASKNTWGFPKGKINEGELPLECAIREAFEEVGFDAKNHISDKIRPLQCFVGETLVCLYLATDVPMDFQFQPHLRKEIRKISWFSVWDLPKDRNDDKGCARLGLQPNNFYAVLPFIGNICNFILREQAERNKPKCSLLKHEGKSENSAFQPVIPRASSNQKLSILTTPTTSTLNLMQQSHPAEASTSTGGGKSAVENLFKPLKIEPTEKSFTGQTFLEHIIKATASPGGGLAGDKEQQTPKNPGVIGAESRRRNKEIKQPKPLHPSKLIVNVYEAPSETQHPDTVSPESSQKKQRMGGEIASSAVQTPTGESGGGGNEIVNMLRSSIGKKPSNFKEQPKAAAMKAPVAASAPVAPVPKKKASPKLVTASVPPAVAAGVQQPPATATVVPPANKPQPLLQMVPTQVQLCEAWKKFTFDRERFHQQVALRCMELDKNRKPIGIGH